MLSDHDANIALNAIINTAGGVTVGLSTTAPARTSAGTVGATNITEPPTAAGYARVSLTNSDWASAGNRIKPTAVDITFPAPTGDWGQVGWVVVWDGPRFVFSGELARLVNVVAGGDQLRIPAGTLSLALPE